MGSQGPGLTSCPSIRWQLTLGVEGHPLLLEINLGACPGLNWQAVEQVVGVSRALDGR